MPSPPEAAAAPKEGTLLHRRAEGAGIAEEARLVYQDPEDFTRWVIPVLKRMHRGTAAAAADITERQLRNILASGKCGRAETRRHLTLVAGEWAAAVLGRAPSAHPLDDCGAFVSLFLESQGIVVVQDAATR